MKGPGWQWISLLCLVLTGCSAYTVNPLYTAEDAVVEPAVEGTWISSDRTEVRVAKGSADAYIVAITEPQTRVVQRYRVHLVRIGDQLFADMMFQAQTLNAARLNDVSGAVPMHVILKLQIANDELRYAVLAKNGIRNATQRDMQAPDNLMVEGVMVLTAPTETLRSYVSGRVDTIFTNWDSLQRGQEGGRGSRRCFSMQSCEDVRSR